ncbi:MAG: aspartate/glutamate racemase family protein [Acaryochloris sp. CRU_2_0]|nr:aspartate/glutamate racemase family protein [Acaryochloris sp. CRU_2_0]
MCTNGTRKLEIFQSNTLWQVAKEHITLLDEDDQDTVHKMIYQIKINAYSPHSIISFLEKLKEKYQADYLIAGCTEFHLLNRSSFLMSNLRNDFFLDPLTIVAEKLDMSFRNYLQTNSVSSVNCNGAVVS